MKKYFHSSSQAPNNVEVQGKIKKKITIKLIGDAEKAFQDLNRIVGEQHSKGITSSKDITLLDAINRIFDIIASNPFYGENAKKDLIPKEYRQKYDQITFSLLICQIIGE
ncbi:hypothetical protein HYW20_06655 [Candidatus Woesearchaeota archaeon]|nr:hypothetical protein [Candidatus Woesearchaeota archaeon]